MVNNVILPPTVVVVMGVSGSGKSTIAAELADQMGWKFAEGDLMHSAANISKMTAGTGLSDTDRLPWLDQIAQWAQKQLTAGQSGVISCSALKRSYRDIIAGSGGGVVFVYLAGTFDLFAPRISSRHTHFMPRQLLQSQLDLLEEPTSDEGAMTLDAGQPAQVLVEQIVTWLGTSARS